MGIRVKNKPSSAPIATTAVCAALACAIGAANADPSTIYVKSLSADRPLAAGQYAAVSATIASRPGKSAFPQVAIGVRQSDGTFKPFAVWPFTNPHAPTTLTAGSSYSFRSFQRIMNAGDYDCAVIAKDDAGRWSPLTYADGSPARIDVRADAPAQIASVRYVIDDSKPHHVYGAGSAIALNVQAIVSGGPSLGKEVESLNISTPAKPWSITDPAQAQAYLVGTPPDRDGFNVDFFRSPEENKRINIAVRFRHAVNVSSFVLRGTNPNDQFGPGAVTAAAVSTGGAGIDVPVFIAKEGENWAVTSALPSSVRATAITVSIAVPYKLQMKSFDVSGDAGGDSDASPAPSLSCQWEDAAGNALDRPAPIAPFANTPISSPANLAPGYYGLVFTSKLAGQDPQRSEFGFVVLPQAALQPADPADRDARIGLVHADINDPYLRPGWVKTMTAGDYNERTGVLDTASWKSALADRQKLGVQELPLVVGSPWVSEGDQPVTQDQLDRLKHKMAQYFTAAPDVRYYELGIEENLGYRHKRDQMPDFWTNLAAKAAVVRQAAVESGADIKLIYQIAEDDLPDVELFLKSGAAKQFDILAIHPYWWPDFPPPERWMPDYVGKIHALMAQYGKTMPIWSTEIGAPVDDNPGRFAGYPGDPGVFDRALSRSEHAQYMLKCYLVSWQQGVDKVFWYNQFDRGDNPEYAEDHFGLVDHWGFPKPTYAAYATMTYMLTDKPLESARVVHGNVELYRFKGKSADTLVLWTYPAARVSVPASALGIPGGAAAQVYDMYGKPLHESAGALSLSESPIYVTLPAGADSRASR